MILRYIGAAHAFEYLSGDSRDDRTWVKWSFTIMWMPRGLPRGVYTVLLLRDFREVFTLEYLDPRSPPSSYQSETAVGEIPQDVLREIERAMSSVVVNGGPF